MSFYATIEGVIQYSRQEDFDAAVKILADGQWLQEGYLVAETGGRISEDPDIDAGARRVSIPWALHRNLARVLGKGRLFRGGMGKVVWTSTDGTFEAGVIRDGEEQIYDLVEWGRRNVGDPPDVDQSPEAYVQWQGEVEQTFFDRFGTPRYPSESAVA